MNGLYEQVLRMLLVTVVVVFVSNPFEFRPRIIFMDVGQGDSILILPEPGYQILVDGGPGDQLFESLGKHIPPWDRKIEVVLLSHAHADHINGILAAQKRYHIENIIYNPLCGENELQNRLEAQAANSKTVLQQGEYVGLGRGGEWMLNIPYPQGVAHSANYCDAAENINNASVVSQFEMNGIKVLLMGDAEIELERRLLSDNLIGDVDILKAGHHCSKTSSSTAFLGVAKPETAICSVGEDNRYGHPHYETIQKFEQMGVEYRLTSQEGDIVINL